MAHNVKLNPALKGSNKTWQRDQSVPQCSGSEQPSAILYDGVNGPWIYVHRLKADPERRHKVKGRTNFAFSNVRRLIAKAALNENFNRVCPKPGNPTKNTPVDVLLRMVYWCIFRKLKQYNILLPSKKNRCMNKNYLKHFPECRI